MRDEVLTDSWARALGERLNASPGYRAAAAGWEGSLVLVLDDEADADRRAAYLDLWHGECRSARGAAPEDLEEADLVLQASREHWQAVLSGALDPVTAVMNGKLRLVRGSLSRLLPHIQAARELLAAARSLEEVLGTQPDDL